MAVVATRPAWTARPRSVALLRLRGARTMLVPPRPGSTAASTSPTDDVAVWPDTAAHRYPSCHPALARRLPVPTLATPRSTAREATWVPEPDGSGGACWAATGAGSARVLFPSAASTPRAVAAVCAGLVDIVARVDATRRPTPGRRSGLFAGRPSARRSSASTRTRSALALAVRLAQGWLGAAAAGRAASGGLSAAASAAAARERENLGAGMWGDLRGAMGSR
ncbi:MAG: hypothetical protein AUI14_12950 [Actinobacteria bacterium 13_2_20CM_2_71_6]|nr:MAG: hypothetical protein AUI14_12950 [Actinobacteria bacterium 13_2_20CM_2_71_6]